MNPNTGAIYPSVTDAIKQGEDPDDIVEVDSEQAMTKFRERLSAVEAAAATDAEIATAEERDALREKWRNREETR